MSYESINYLPENTSKAKVLRLIDLLGYKKGAKIDPSVFASYTWYENSRETISYVGIELSVLKDEDGLFQIYTRTRAGRSFWDLEKQNETIRLLRSYLGGYFQTDEGINRYFPKEDEPSKLQAALFLPRWKYENEMTMFKMFISTRGMKQEGITKDALTGIGFIDALNTRFFSNELLIPYFVAIWENYLRSSYVMILRHANIKELKRLKKHFQNEELRMLVDGKISFEEAYANTLSFQRPEAVSENFKALDSRLDLGGVLKKPFRKRKRNLYSSISEYVDFRNEVVHSGTQGRNLTDAKIQTIAADFTYAVDKIYEEYERCYGLELSRDF